MVGHTLTSDIIVKCLIVVAKHKFNSPNKFSIVRLTRKFDCTVILKIASLGKN